MEPLESVLQHRPILFPEDVGPNLDPKIGAHAEHKSIEGRVMEHAEGEPVRNHRPTFGMPIGQDMSGIQQLAMAEVTDGTLLAVRHKYPYTKRLLMQPGNDGACGVAPVGVACGLCGERQYKRQRPIWGTMLPSQSERPAKDNAGHLRRK